MHLTPVVTALNPWRVYIPRESMKQVIFLLKLHKLRIFIAGTNLSPPRHSSHHGPPSPISQISLQTGNRCYVENLARREWCSMFHWESHKRPLLQLPGVFTASCTSINLSINTYIPSRPWKQLKIPGSCTRGLAQLTLGKDWGGAGSGPQAGFGASCYRIMTVNTMLCTGVNSILFNGLYILISVYRITAYVTHRAANTRSYERKN